MVSLHQFTTPAAPCNYLPGERASMHYDVVLFASAEDYQERLLSGWRRFGRAMFRPACKTCRSCLSLRVPVATFRPDRSQRRARKANADVELVIDEPSVTAEKLHLYDRFHEFQVDAKDWPAHDPKEPDDYSEMFVENPFPTEEWRYYLGDRLIGVGYVDVMPDALSAIYFFHDPADRGRSLGTYNVLRILESAGERGIPNVYLGYFVEGCRSLEYKARFGPNEVFDGANWEGFR